MCDIVDIFRSFVILLRDTLFDRKFHSWPVLFQIKVNRSQKLFFVNFEILWEFSDGVLMEFLSGNEDISIMYNMFQMGTNIIIQPLYDVINQPTKILRNHIMHKDM